jgi:DNA-binding transcriptional LysR family regulator
MGDDDIRIFLAMAKHGTVAAAARSLGLSEDRLMVQAEALRAGRGARMIERTSSGYELTPTGKAALAHFEWIKDAVLAAEAPLH